ncbi:MAG: DUF456 family protein [Longimicrobiales bacterium]
MIAALLSVAAVLVMLGLLLVIPFGIPGLWLMVCVMLGLVLLGQLGWTVGLVAAGAVLVAEIAEFWILKRFGSAYGGSRRAFWGAVVGGFAGLFVGVPVPVVGPVITAFLGTFLGALAVTWLETRSWGQSARVGWGVMLARATAIALKVGVGVVLLLWVTVLLVL